MADKAKETTEKVYKAIPHTWTDMWAEDNEQEKSVCYRFSRPSPADIKRMQAGAQKNANNAALQLMKDTVHPDDLDKMLADFEKYPALVATVSSAILRSCGLADLGN